MLDHEMGGTSSATSSTTPSSQNRARVTKANSSSRPLSSRQLSTSSSPITASSSIPPAARALPQIGSAALQFRGYSPAASARLGLHRYHQVVPILAGRKNCARNVLLKETLHHHYDRRTFRVKLAPPRT